MVHDGPLVGLSGVTPASVFQREAPQKPTPDGKLVVHTVYGGTHEYQYKDMPQGWRHQATYLSISTPYGRIQWPWRSILNFETHVNSNQYRADLEKWLVATGQKREEEADECQA